MDKKMRLEGKRRCLTLWRWLIIRNAKARRMLSSEFLEGLQQDTTAKIEIDFLDCANRILGDGNSPVGIPGTARLAAEECLKELESGEHVQLKIGENSSFKWPRTVIVGKNSVAHSIEVVAQDQICFEEGMFSNVVISDVTTSTIKNCVIKKLVLKNCANVKIEDTRIAQIVVKGSIKSLEISRSAVFNIEATGDFRANFIKRRLEISDLWLPSKDYGLDCIKPQSFRFMGEYCKYLNNRQAAAIFNAAVLALERKNERLIPRMLSNLYKCFSNYGTDAGRPLLWWLAALAGTVITLGSCEGVISTNPSGEGLLGWQTELNSQVPIAAYWRAFAMSIYQMSLVGPLFVGGETLPLIASSGWAKALLSISSVFSGLQIALFVLALRKKFKLES